MALKTRKKTSRKLAQLPSPDDVWRAVALFARFAEKYERGVLRLGGQASAKRNKKIISDLSELVAMFNIYKASDDLFFTDAMTRFNLRGLVVTYREIASTNWNENKIKSTIEERFDYLPNWKQLIVSKKTITKLGGPKSAAVYMLADVIDRAERTIFNAQKRGRRELSIYYDDPPSLEILLSRIYSMDREDIKAVVRQVPQHYFNKANNITTIMALNDFIESYMLVDAE